MLKLIFITVTSIFLILLSILLQFYLIELFPFTGLGKISIPFVIILSISISVYYVYLCVRKNHNIPSMFILSFIFICFLQLAFFPQSESSLWEKVGGYYSAYKDYESIKEDALFLPETNKAWYSEKQLFATYIAALYKYRDNIPMDGSYSIYLDHLDTTAVYTYQYDPIIRDKNDITGKMKTGAEKLFYRILSKFKK